MIRFLLALSVMFGVSSSLVAQTTADVQISARVINIESVQIAQSALIPLVKEMKTVFRNHPDIQANLNFEIPEIGFVARTSEIYVPTSEKFIQGRRVQIVVSYVGN